MVRFFVKIFGSLEVVNLKERLAYVAAKLLNQGVILSQESVKISLETSYKFLSETFVREAESAGVSLDQMVAGINEFYDLCKSLELPTHNAVAFYTAIEKKQDDLCKTSREALEEVLICAAAGSGFLFGTFFLNSGNTRLRPCDIMIMTGTTRIPLKDLFRNCLQGIVFDRNYPQFCDEYAWIREKLVDPINKGRAEFDNWSTLINKNSEIGSPLSNLSQWMYEQFWKVYCEYSLAQYSEGQERERKEAEICLQEIKEIAGIVLTLDRFWVLLEKILRIPANTNHKRRWLNCYRRYLKDIAPKLKRIKSPFDEELIITFGLKDFLIIAKREKVPTDFLKQYPIWDEQTDISHLKREERNILQGYRKHPIYQFLKGIRTIFSKEGTIKAAPFVLSKFLQHEQSPANPFLRKTYKISPHLTAFQSNLCSEDKRSTLQQISHQWLFQALFQLWNTIYPEGHPFEQNKELSIFLFQRCQRHVLNCSDISTNTNYFSLESHIKFMHHMQQKIETSLLLNYSVFPQYAYTSITETTFEEFYKTIAMEKYVKSKEWEIRRRLNKLVTDEVAQEYKKIALLPEHGIGMSAPIWDWHINIAVWLEEIISKDSVVFKYVEGDEDVLYPGTDIPVREMSRMTKIDDEHTLHPEFFQSYLAQVELLIQMLCYERIRNEMRKTVLSLYRKVFLE